MGAGLIMVEMMRAGAPVDSSKGRGPRSLGGGACRPCPSDGFTLAELLVASIMMTIVMTAVYTTFNSTIRSWRRGEANYQTYENARMSLGLLTRELQAVPPGTHHLFSGTKDELVFITLSPPMNVEDADGVRVLWVRYRVKPGRRRGEGGTLVRQEALVESALSIQSEPGGLVDTTRLKLGRKHELDLATGVLDLDLRYCWAPPPRRSQGGAPQRVQMIVARENLEGQGLPRGIKVSLTLLDPGSVSGRNGTTFSSFVVFRGKTTSLRDDVYRRWFGSGLTI